MLAGAEQRDGSDKRSGEVWNPRNRGKPVSKKHLEKMQEVLFRLGEKAPSEEMAEDSLRNLTRYFRWLIDHKDKAH